MTTQLRHRIDEVLEADGIGGLHGVVAVRGGHTVLEDYRAGEDFAWGRSLGVVDFGPDTLHDIRSVTKSVTGLVYGIALDQGLVPPPAEPILRYFPQYSDLAADPQRTGLTVEHALTMSLGLEWREDIPYNSPANAEIAMELAADRYRYVLQRPVIEPPGARWAYCGGATALLGGLIAEGTGQSLPEFAQSMLFAPLGITRFEWMSGPAGVASAASGLRLAPRDLARIGELVLAEGDWAGQRIVSAAWVRAMLQPRLPSDWGWQYGYQWYIGSRGDHRLVAGMGNGGQRLYAVPDLDLVVAVAAGNYDGAEQWRVPEAVLERVILPAMA